MRKKLYVISPNRKTTGGVELLHQLVDSVNAQGGEAYIVYFPFSREHAKPSAYEKYNVPQAKYIECDDAQSVVLVPETLTHLLRRFKRSQLGIWWLSVDNYFGSQKLRFLAANKLWPGSYWVPGDNLDLLHISQSYYGLDFLSKHNILSGNLLSDYLNDEITAAIEQVSLSAKQNVVVYNPAKRPEQSRAILKKLDAEIEVIPLSGFTRVEMIAQLQRAKVYIDFGNHPGKDRIPREAAILGCCVITNRRGSARNVRDISIPDKYKIDDSLAGFESEAALLVKNLLLNYSGCLNDFAPYREAILREKAQFTEQVSQFMSHAAL